MSNEYNFHVSHEDVWWRAQLAISRPAWQPIQYIDLSPSWTYNHWQADRVPLVLLLDLTISSSHIPVSTHIESFDSNNIPSFMDVPIEIHRRILQHVVDDMGQLWPARSNSSDLPPSPQIRVGDRLIGIPALLPVNHHLNEEFRACSLSQAVFKCPYRMDTFVGPAALDIEGEFHDYKPLIISSWKSKCSIAWYSRS